jgi:hypothetical protein
MAATSSALNLIGITSLMAVDVAKGAIRFVNVNTDRSYAPLFVVPGLYNVASQLLKRSNHRLAQVLSPGNREDRKEIMGFKRKNKYKYIGMLSGTIAPVVNAAFEAWITLRETKPEKSSQYFRLDVPGNPTVLNKVTVKNNYEGNIKISIQTKYEFIFSLSLQIAALVVFMLMIKTGDGWGIGINLANMVVYCIIIRVVAADELYTPAANPAHDVPQGNCIVTDSTGNNLCAVIGTERIIQNLAQRDLVLKSGAVDGIFEIIIAVLGCMTAFATMLLTPIMSKNAKIYLAIQFFIGLLANILFSSQDGDSMLAQVIDNCFEIEVDTKIRFTNRATAVAAATLSTRKPAHPKECNQTIAKNLLAETETYKDYWDILEQIRDMDPNNRQQLIDYFNRYPNNGASRVEAATMFNRKFDLRSLKKVDDDDAHSLNVWPRRLIIDIIEAFIQVYCQNNHIDNILI